MRARHAERTEASGVGAARPIPRRNGLREEVYEAILELIVQDVIGEGSALRVEALAQRLDVSPTPVREALVQLEATGLVDHVANKGFTVARHPDAAELAELMDARAVLEVAAVRRAALAADSELIDQLADLLTLQERAAARLPSDDNRARRAQSEYLAADHAFHDAIFAGSRNRHLARLAHTLDAQSQRARQSSRRGVRDAAEAIAEHHAILDAIRSGDADAAEEAMTGHLRRVLEHAVTDAD